MKLMPCILILGARPKECKDTHTHTHKAAIAANLNLLSRPYQNRPHGALARVSATLQYRLPPTHKKSAA